MSSCEFSQILMADQLYGQLSREDELQLQSHLGECADCRGKLQALQQARADLESIGLSGQAFDDIPERAALDTLWERLQPDLAATDASRDSHHSLRRFMPHAMTALATAASLLVFLFVFQIGPGIQSIPLQSVNDGTEPEVVSPDLMRYLGRVESMLLTVANAQQQQDTTIPIGQSFARDLAFEANLLAASADDSFSTGQSRLLRDIEFLLLQVANLDESNMEAGVELLQRYIEENSILFKIRLLEMRQQRPVI